MLDAMSVETMEIGDAITKVLKLHDSERHCNVQHIRDWYADVYDSSDKSSVHSILRTNPAYAGLTHPMKKTACGQWEPDFEYRYLTEDIPFGLCVIKGLAELTGVETPAVDKVLRWAQRMMRKEYICPKTLQGCGEDMAETRAPGAFGLRSLPEILSSFYGKAL